MSSLPTIGTAQSVYGDGNTYNIGSRAYFAEDFIAPMSTSLLAGAVSGLMSGLGNGPGSGTGTLVLPSAELGQHPGLAYTATVVTGYAGLSVGNTAVPMTNTAGVSYMHTLTFRTPPAASNATNAYTLYLGCFSTGTSAAPGDGVGICYTHSANGGMWQAFTMCAAYASTPTYTNTAAGFQPGVWHLLRLIGTGAVWQVLVNEVPIASLADPAWVGGSLLNASVGSMLLSRTASPLLGATTVTSVIDRATLYVDGYAR